MEIQQWLLIIENAYVAMFSGQCLQIIFAKTTAFSNMLTEQMF